MKVLIAWIHSSIGELLLKGAISGGFLVGYDKIVLLADREYTAFFEWDSIYPINELVNISDIRKIRSSFFDIRKIRNTFESAKGELERIVHKSNYDLFLPHSNDLIIRFLLENEKCNNLYYYEEGIGSFGRFTVYKKMRSYKTPVKDRIKHYLCFGNNISLEWKFLDFWHKKYCGCFALTDQCFVDAPGLQKINLEFAENSRELKRLSTTVRNYENIIVFDAYYTISRFLDIDTFFLALLSLVKKIENRGYKVAHYKKHPKQYGNEDFDARLNYFIDCVSDKVNLIEIPSGVPLEMLSLIEGRNFYVIFSSVGLYAALNEKNTVYSIGMDVIKLSGGKVSEGGMVSGFCPVPKVFWDKVIQI